MSTLNNGIAPIFAESVLTALGPRGQSCPHYPKVRSSLDTGIPSCLAFWGQESNILLVLKTAALCTACYASLVPRGYTNVISTTPKPLTPAFHSEVSLKVTGFDHSNKPSLELLNLLSTQTDIQSVIESRSSGRPLYCHAFHIFSRTTPLLQQRQRLDLSIVSSAAIQPSTVSDNSHQTQSPQAGTSTNSSKGIQHFVSNFRLDGKLSNPRQAAQPSSTIDSARDLGASGFSSSIRVSKYSDRSSVTQISVHLTRHGINGANPAVSHNPSIPKASRIESRSESTYKSPSVEDDASEEPNKPSSTLRSPAIGGERLPNLSNDAPTMVPLAGSSSSSKRGAEKELSDVNNSSQETCLMPNLQYKPLMQPETVPDIVRTDPRMNRRVSPAKTKSKIQDKALQTNSTLQEAQPKLGPAASRYEALPSSRSNPDSTSSAIRSVVPPARDRNEGSQASRPTTVGIRASTSPSPLQRPSQRFPSTPTLETASASNYQNASTKFDEEADASNSHRSVKSGAIPAQKTIHQSIGSNVSTRTRPMHGSDAIGTTPSSEDQMGRTESIGSSHMLTNRSSNLGEPRLGASSGVSTSQGAKQYSSQRFMGQTNGARGTRKLFEPSKESLPPVSNHHSPGTGYRSSQAYPNTQHKVPLGKRKVIPTARTQTTPATRANTNPVGSETKNTPTANTASPIYQNAPSQRSAPLPLTPTSNPAQTASTRMFGPSPRDGLRGDSGFAHNFYPPNRGVYPPNSARAPVNMGMHQTNTPRVQVYQNYTYRPTTNFHPQQTQYQQHSSHHNNAHTAKSEPAEIPKPEKHATKTPEQPPEPTEPPGPDKPPHPKSPPVPDDPPKPEEPPGPQTSPEPTDPLEPDHPPEPDEPLEPHDPPDPEHHPTPDDPEDVPQPDEPYDSHGLSEPDDHDDPFKSPGIDEDSSNNNINQNDFDDTHDTTHHNSDIDGKFNGADTDEYEPYNTSTPQHENDDMEEPQRNDGQAENTDDQTGDDSAHILDSSDPFMNEEPDDNHENHDEGLLPEDGGYGTSDSVPEEDVNNVNADTEKPENSNDHGSVEDNITDNPGNGDSDFGQEDDLSDHRDDDIDNDELNDELHDDDNNFELENNDSEDYDDNKDFSDDDDDQADLEDTEPNDYIDEDQQEGEDDQVDQFEQDDDQDLDNDTVEDDQFGNDIDDVVDNDDQQEQDVEEYDPGNEDDDNYNEQEHGSEDIDEDQNQPDDGPEHMDNEYDNDEQQYEEPDVGGDEPEYDNDIDNDHGEDGYDNDDNGYNDNGHDANDYDNDGGFDNEYGADDGYVDGGGYVEGEVDNEPQDGGFNEYNTGGYGETGDY